MPYEKGAALDRAFEPLMVPPRDAAVQINLDCRLLFAGKLAHLETAGMRGALPIHQPGAVSGFVGANPVKVEARSSNLGFDLTGNGFEHQPAIGLSFERRIDNRLAAQRYHRGLSQKAE